MSYDIAEYLVEEFPDNIDKKDIYTMGKGNIKKRFF
jgi:hypothetical protein